ncbi:MAG: hypothetical protein IKB34_04770 [Clostridia bacterium]|nr:hypothetical protein [Clostridia bacterium]
MDKELFKLATEAALVVEREKGIGTLSEGLLHSAIKYYYQPDSMLHEMKVAGFVCDAVTDDRRFGYSVLEVQTSSFGYLKRKLERLFSSVELGEAADAGHEAAKSEKESCRENISKEIVGEENAGNAVKPRKLSENDLAARNGGKEIDFPGSVTVVYPLESSKQLIWIDPDTGDTVQGGKSKKGFIPARCLWELYSLKEFVGKKGFTFVILGLKLEEQKLLCGWSKDRKRGSRRVARIPIELTHELIFKELSDYAALVPEELGDRFGAADFRKATKMTERTARAALYCLMEIGVLDREREGRGYRYYVREDIQKTSDKFIKNDG